MSEEKAPWFKRFGLWIVAGLSAVVLFVLTAGRKSPASAPVIIPPPAPPDVPPVVVPPVGTAPFDDYEKNKVVPMGVTSKARVAKVLIGLRSKDAAKKD
jgi:hypothetical protein